jgi:hypothetical protein
LKGIFLFIDSTVSDTHICNYNATSLLTNTKAKMFADNVSVLRALVAKRSEIIHQMDLDRRRWSVRRDVLRDVKDTFLPALEAAIARSHTDWGHSVVLRTYTNDEWEEEDADGITLDEVFRKTDVLARVANCLAPGFFQCRVSPPRCGRPARHHLVRVWQIVARFHAGGVEAEKPPCTCVLPHLTDGFCDVCGGHNVRDLVRYPREDAADKPLDRGRRHPVGRNYVWKCHVCRNEDQKEMLHCIACGSERLNADAILAAPAASRQINNPEDEEE